MKIHSTKITGCFVIEPEVFGDERGFFMETFRASRFKEHGLPDKFLQDNYSRSGQGILRGLHYQIQNPQGKLVQVVRGEVFDVAVDLRKDSPSFGQWEAVILNEQEQKQFYVPPGCAHGFYVMSPSADFSYKCTEQYAPEHEYSLLWNDPDLAILWPFDGEPKLSEKDQKALLFKQCPVFETSPSVETAQ